MSFLDFPFHVDGAGRTAVLAEDEAGRHAHLRDLIEQVLFTRPGERVNRPEFGSGLLQLVFAPASAELAASLQFTVQAALQQYLADSVEIDEVAVASEDSTLRVRVRYRLRSEEEGRVVEFVRSAS